MGVEVKVEVEVKVKVEVKVEVEVEVEVEAGVGRVRLGSVQSGSVRSKHHCKSPPKVRCHATPTGKHLDRR
jgi:hypothetical protein